MSTIRAQVRLPYTSGLAEDVVTNTFHFQTPTPAGSAEYNDIFARIDAYYDQVGPFLSALISRTAPEIRLYDVEDLVPRVPVATDTMTIPAATVTTSLPCEVACVHSFRGEYASGQPPARRRGRVYVGPFVSSAAQLNANQASIPSAALITAIQAAGDTLSADSLATGVRWVVYSPTSSGWFLVTRQWVNNEWDTQRRRQVRATARNEVPVVQP